MVDPFSTNWLFRPITRSNGTDMEHINETLQALFVKSVERYAERTLIKDEHSGLTMTYEEVKDAAMQLLSALQNKGIRRGQRICIYSPTRWQALIVYWAATLGGFVFVSIDPETPLSRLKSILRFCEPALFCYSPSSVIIENLPITNLLLFEDEPDSSEKHSFTNYLKAGGRNPSLPTMSPEDPAVILFTSGTTGEAKGVLHSHGALFQNALNGVNFFGWQKDDTVICQGDLHTMSGIRCTGMVSLHSGSSFVILSPSARKNIFAIGAAIATYKCTIINTIPAFYKQLLAFHSRIPTGTLNSIRILISGGADIDAVTVNRFREVYGKQILNIYGQTEACGLVIAQPPSTEKHIDGLLGCPVGCEISCRGDNGVEVSSGEQGELFVRTPMIMLGYYGKTNGPFTDNDGWYATGDIVKIKDNMVFLTGRKADFIKTSRADRVHPREVEQLIETHESVKEAGVFGVKATSGDEYFATYIVCKPNIEFDSLVTDLRNIIMTELGMSRVPKHFTQCNELPRGAYGKLQRKTMKEMFLGLIN